MKHWGKHVIVDAQGCNLRSKDPTFIMNWTKELVKKIDMIPYGSPQVVHFADGTDKAGWTVIQLIQTSSIVGHFVDIDGDLYLDVFSCKDFDAKTITDHVKHNFGPVKISTHTVWRDAKIGSTPDIWLENTSKI